MSCAPCTAGLVPACACCGLLCTHLPEPRGRSSPLACLGLQSQPPRTGKTEVCLGQAELGHPVPKVPLRSINKYETLPPVHLRITARPAPSARLLYIPKATGAQSWGGTQPLPSLAAGERAVQQERVG